VPRARASSSLAFSSALDGRPRFLGATAGDGSAEVGAPLADGLGLIWRARGRGLGAGSVAEKRRLRDGELVAAVAVVWRGIGALSKRV
jgi:hypothetical protein